MNNLQIINHENKLMVDSRNVADMVGKRHDNLMRDINGYYDILTTSDLRASDFFISSSYKDAKGESRPMYLLTRKGCDMTANKMTGKKGTVFTATYVTKFEEMEKQLSQSTANLQKTIFDPDLMIELCNRYKTAIAGEALALQQAEQKQKEQDEQAPVIKFVDECLQSKRSITMTKIAKELGFRSSTQLNKLLAENKIQFKDKAGQWHLYSPYAGFGYTAPYSYIDEKGDTVHFTN